MHRISMAIFIHDTRNLVNYYNSYWANRQILKPFKSNNCEVIMSLFTKFGLLQNSKLFLITLLTYCYIIWTLITQGRSFVDLDDFNSKVPAIEAYRVYVTIHYKF